ncbi:hypothetical protein W02_17460 [Nitrospira sp. KM1]|uniref:hypothetical protein n=1 Tax=Nitrospira sp. KM1 TaxID=1936990 RepID=UPI0013A7444B|nr:hypothetical protein [Nitrospira sp. KM1]BCA54606.1 hypothetical protein W02_17460 [Nitrospira sp. KM1]
MRAIPGWDHPGRRLRPSLHLSAALLFSTATGCSFLIPSTNHTTASERHCTPATPVSFSRAQEYDSAAPPEVETDIPLSPRALEVASVMDVMPILSSMSKLQSAGETRSIAYLELRQALTDRLLLTMFEVSSAVAEIVCERDRADQVADRMEEIDAAMVRKLTLVSIVVGGVAAAVSGGIGLAGGASTASDAAALAGGVLASVFGGTALFATSKQEFHHERNLLKEVWDNPQQSAVISPAVWRYLQARHKEPETTARGEVVNAWQQQGRLGEQGSSVQSQRIPLFFGPGGVYTATDLRARASMLETLEAQIQLLTEELELFLREIMQLRYEEALQGQRPSLNRGSAAIK